MNRDEQALRDEERRKAANDAAFDAWRRGEDPDREYDRVRWPDGEDS